MSAKDEYRAFLETKPVVDRPLIVDIPPAPPTLHRRHRAALSQSRFAVGIEAEPYEEELTGAVWQYWFMLGVAIAFLAPAGVGMLLLGEWIIVLVLAPIVGLFLLGLVRSLRAEQKVKQQRRTQRLYNERK